MKKSFYLFVISFLLLCNSAFLKASSINESEPNDTEITAQSVSLVYTSDDANDTIQASINTAGDVDYYAVTLTDKYLHYLSVDVFDKAHNSSAGKYTTDVKIYYKIGTSSWSDASDYYFTGLKIAGPTTIYFKVIMYSTSTIGTYALNIQTMRTVVPTIPISLVFNSDVANDTVNETLKLYGEIDYYSIDLPAGYSYLLDANLLDYSNSDYSLHGTISYKLNNDSWSTSSSHENKDIICAGPAVLYVKIKNATASTLNFVDTYGFNYKITRSTNNFIKIDNDEFYFGAEQVDSSLNVTCSGDWTATSDQNWLVVNTPKGSGNSKLSFRVLANSITNDRIATIKVSTLGNAPYTININQELYIVPDNYEPNNTESNYSILPLGTFTNDETTVSTVDANIHLKSDIDYYKIRLPVGYNYLVTYTKQDYYSDYSPYTGGVYPSAKHANTSFSVLKSFICQDKDSIMMKVTGTSKVGTYQMDTKIKRFTGNLLTVDQTAINLIKNADSYYFYVYSNLSWSAACDQSWVTLLNKTGTGVAKFFFNVSANTGVQRSAIILLTATGVSTVAITLTQEGNKIIVDSYEVNNTEATASVLPVTYINHSATVLTNAATLHTSDVDYYTITVPAGFNYNISAKLFDNDYTFDSQSQFSATGVFYCKINSGPWTRDYDNFNEININNGGTLYFKIEPYSKADTGSYQLSLVINGSVITSSPNIENAESFNVFPNPSCGDFTIVLDNKISAGVLKIYDINGRIVYNKTNINAESGTEMKVSTSLIRGIYILEISDKKTQKIKRINIINSYNL